MYSVIHTENDGKVIVTRVVFRNSSIDECWDFVAMWLNSDNRFTRETGLELDVVDKINDIQDAPAWIVKARKNAMHRVFARKVSA